MGVSVKQNKLQDTICFINLVRLIPCQSRYSSTTDTS